MDSPHAVRLADVATRLASQGADVYRSAPVNGWARMTASLEGIGHIGMISSLLGSVGIGRAAIAEDNDEFGAMWAVLSAEDGTVSTVHRRYLLNADPANPTEVALALRDLDGVDPRRWDVAGEQAAAAAAVLFSVESSVMVAAERDSATAFREIGTVGGPFPWWDALGLPWPGPRAGEPVRPDPAATTVRRINRATWPPFAARHLLSRLPDPERWAVIPFGVVRQPSTWLLHGLAWSASSGDWFHAYAFVLPLYRPTEHLYFNYSHELLDARGRRGFDLPTPDTADQIGADLALAVTDQGLGHLDTAGTLEGYAAMLADRQARMLAEGRTGRVDAEELGYTLLLLGRNQDAAAQLAAAAIVEPGAPDWQLARASRATLVAELATDPPSAVAQLNAWAQQSADALGISREPLPADTPT